MACASRPAQSRPDLRVLVVEDEALLLFDLVDMLSTAGFAVVEAGADGEAMAVLHTNAMIDILITDIQLGGDQSGWDLAEAYRGIHPAGGVIYTSADAPLSTRQVPESVFLAKPVNMRVLIETCHHLSGEGRGRHIG